MTTIHKQDVAYRGNKYTCYFWEDEIRVTSHIGMIPEHLQEDASYIRCNFFNEFFDKNSYE